MRFPQFKTRCDKAISLVQEQPPPEEAKPASETIVAANSPVMNAAGEWEESTDIPASEPGLTVKLSHYSFIKSLLFKPHKHTRHDILFNIQDMPFVEVSRRNCVCSHGRKADREGRRDHQAFADEHRVKGAD